MTRSAQVRSGQVRSSQVRSCEATLIWKHTCSIQHVIQKLPTKFHVNRAIEPRVIIVDTQIASAHFLTFAICLHIETGISKSFICPPFFAAHPWWCFTRNLCQILLIFEEANEFKSAVFTLTLKGQRSFRDHNTSMTYILMVRLLILFSSRFWPSKYIRTKTTGNWML